MDLRGKFTHIFIDADDTLWENEKFFREAEVKFAKLLCEYTSPEDLKEMLWHKQEDNIPLFGYGSKTYMIGMTDAAVELCGGHLTDKIYYGIKRIITDIAYHKFIILDGVKETLESLYGHYTLVVATKGDLPEQMNKFRNNQTYQAILLILTDQVAPFLQFGRLDGFRITAPPFNQLPPSGDEITVPNAWEATYVDEVRSVTVYGTLYITQPTR